MSRPGLLYFLIILIATAEFFISNEGLKGYLRSQAYLARELKTPPDSLEQFRLAKEPPFKYRVMFPSIVSGTHRLLYDDTDDQGFYHAYRFWSLVFFVCSACAFFWLLLQCGFTAREGFAGSLIFLLLPAMLMAYTLPVHTREDMLAYTLFFLGLGSLITGRRVAFFLISLAGILTRETLLLLPLLYFFYAKDERWVRRLFISVAPAIAWIILRLTVGMEEYDIWLGLRWNLANPEQVVGFTFVAFNFLWTTFILHFLFYKRNLHYISSDLRFFYKSSVFALLIILVTTFVGGIYNEIRLLHLYSPWMVIFFLDYVRNYNGQVQATFRTKRYWLYAAVCLVVCTGLLYVSLLNRERIIEAGKYAVPYDQWIIFSVFYLLILLLSIPHLLQILSLKKTVK